jgi:LPXTG-motif cell wall-anchored protein
MLLSFIYHHSAHNVAINLNSTTNQTNDQNGNLIYYGAIIAVVAIIIGLVLVLTKRRKK